MTGKSIFGPCPGKQRSLEAALLSTIVRKLVLYDPGIEVAGEEIYLREVIERLETLLGSQTA